jgi:putative GTP pyrophosphokinase
MAERHGSSTPDPELFSKRQVNRAGRLILKMRALAREGTAREVEEFDIDGLNEAWAALAWWRSLHARPLSAVAANLRYHVDRSDGRVRERIDVTQRLKRLETTISKLEREPGNVTQMHDIGGVRAVLPTMRHVYVVRRRLLKSWTIIRERDYIAEPKDTGYRALHLIVRRHGYPIEVQLRTIAQDFWANVVEETGRESGVGLKFGVEDERFVSFFLRMSALMAAFDSAEVSPEEVRASLETLQSLMKLGGRQGSSE